MGGDAMYEKDVLDEITKKRKQWEEGTLKKTLDRFGVTESPNQYYTPADIRDFDFLEKVGFPGEYPFTADIYATSVPGVVGAGYAASGGGLARAGGYSGYGTAEDTRDFYIKMMKYGRPGGPNLAFDLPTQIGYDSDHPMAQSEVGKVGVAVDSLLDMETIYEGWKGDNDIDRIASNFTINAPCNIILAMYFALAEKRGIPLGKLRGTPQNDILKEYVARGTYIFPPKPSMRMVRDTITFCTEHVPNINTISICGFHMREAGANASQVLGFTFANAIAYVNLGIAAGLDIDQFIPRFTFLSMGGSMELFTEVARARAARRMWANIMKERFKAKKPRSWLFRANTAAIIGNVETTAQRPLNNLTRSVIGGVASALSGGGGDVRPCYDEPLGLGHSAEAIQLMVDAQRIVQTEAQLCDVKDPCAGSYYVESLTDNLEAEAWQLIEKIDSIGGAVAAIENGFYHREIARGAYEQHKALEKGTKVMVGVNKYTGDNELEVTTKRMVPHPYSPKKREEAEEKQIAKLKTLKKERENQKVDAVLKQIREAAGDDEVNLIPVFVEAVKAYATVGEICGVLREVFGEYEAIKLAL
jgi:methylmalonyl-CoA mutase N-terminal domain/subunit